MIYIGAYEVQYNRWNGTANDNLWTNSSNWDGNVNPATGEGHVYIPGGLTTYPTGSSPDFTINSGKNMILEPGAQATFGTLSNNGTLNLQADATSMSSLILNNTGVTANIDFISFRRWWFAKLQMALYIHPYFLFKCKHVRSLFYGEYRRVV